MSGMVTTIFAGSDHAGFALRGQLVAHLRERGVSVEDVGAPGTESCDYPDYAVRVGRAVRDNPGAVGLLVCGTGLGICLAANKVRGIRAAAAWSVESARLAKAHNDANVLCLGARFMTEAEARAALDAWLEATFDGGRHERRLAKVAALEAEELDLATRRSP